MDYQNMPDSNKIDTWRIAQDLVRERDIEYYTSRASVSRLYNSYVNCNDFMNANPNAQIQFAHETGMFPSENPDEN